MNEHPYIKYAQALLMEEYNLSSVNGISVDHIFSEIEKGLSCFRMRVAESFEGKTKVKYIFDKIEKGAPDKGVFLSPNAITSDIQAKNLWGAAIKYLKQGKALDLNKSVDIGMSEVPITGEFLSFSEKGNISRGNSKSSMLCQGLGLIATLTPLKPCLQYKIGKKGSPETFNVCIIPDLPVDKMRDFIYIFKRMRIRQLDTNLMIGNVASETKGKKGQEKTTYSPKRPQIFNGNFPNPPKSSALGSITLLGAIGEFAKQSEISDKAKDVLESLKDAPMYMIKYGGATTFSYNHYVVDLAKESKLQIVVDSLYYSKLYNQDRRTSTNTEYQKFDLFTSRFLQLFMPAAFKDFLSFRAEYPEPINILLNTYFIKMEKINQEIVSSARLLGKWLNQVAFFAAKEEVKDKEGKPTYWGDLRKVKSKVLVELESSIFAAKTGDALI
ncbi:MAG: type I-PGING CRISPR-associated protein Cas8c/Csp2, partial [Bacteroidales bacterium]